MVIVKALYKDTLTLSPVYHPQLLKTERSGGRMLDSGFFSSVRGAMYGSYSVFFYSIFRFLFASSVVCPVVRTYSVYSQQFQVQVPCRFGGQLRLRSCILLRLLGGRLAPTSETKTW